MLAEAKARHAANPESRRAAWLRSRLKKYGLTAEEHPAMLEAQGYRCLICHVPEDLSAKGCLAIDHDHTTGRVRGLLCNNCNALLGMAKEDPEVLVAALRYLEAA